MKSLVILLGLALTPLAPAQAQDAGSAIVADFAQCVVSGDRDSASALLETVPGSRAEKAMDMRIKRRFDRCLALSNTARLSPVLTRGAIAAVLYRQLYGQRLPTGMMPQGYKVAWVAGSDAPTGGAYAPYAFAACVASANPEAAHSLTISALRSAEGQAAMTALSAGFPACLPKGSRMTINRMTVRALVAEAMYHLARMPVQGAQ